MSIFFRMLNNLVRDHFKDSFDAVFEHLANEGNGGKLMEEDLRSLMFGDYINPDLEPEDRVYEEIKSIEQFYSVAEQCLEEYNNTHKTRMNLVIFRYVLEHLSRVSRVLRMSGGNALLVGVGGSGRQSLTRLAASMSQMNLFQPEISKNYGKNEWREDLKVLDSFFYIGIRTNFYFIFLPMLESVKSYGRTRETDCFSYHRFSNQGRKFP